MVMTLIYWWTTKPEQIIKSNKQRSSPVWFCDYDSVNYSLTSCQGRLVSQVHMAREVKGQYGASGIQQRQTHVLRVRLCTVYNNAKARCAHRIGIMVQPCPDIKNHISLLIGWFCFCTNADTVSEFWHNTRSLSYHELDEKSDRKIKSGNFFLGGGPKQQDTETWQPAETLYRRAGQTDNSCLLRYNVIS